MNEETKVKIKMNFYNEICKSYHSIDDFRMKLLSLLPLFSLVGIIFIDDGGNAGGDLVGFIGLFAALFTIALFVYEVRGIRRSSNLIQKGRDIEEQLGVQGQFYVCGEEQQKINSNKTGMIESLSNAKFAACLIYSLVFAAWLFIFLKYGLKYETAACAISSAITGAFIAIATYFSLKNQFAA